MKSTILHIQLDNLTEPQLLKKIEQFLDSDNQHTIFTPNPEFLVAARKDNEFKNILNQSDINIPDGFGLKLASRFLTGQKLHRHTGVDTLIKICQLASQKQKSVYFFGAGEGIAQKTAQTLKAKFPSLKIAGAESGGIIDLHASCLIPHTSEAINNLSTLKQNHNIAKIKAAEPDILFVALGQIKQEKWLYQNITKIPSIQLAMGIGGSFDYISHKTPRAPKFLRILGLEWLFRLIQNPKRAKRIWNAVVIFMWMVIREKLSKNNDRTIRPNSPMEKMR